MYNKKQIMTVAWELAKGAAKDHGGKASEYISETMKQSWEIAKYDAKQKVVKMKGMMTNKQNWFIEKLMKGVDGLGIDVLNIAGVREFLQGGYYATTKQDASDLIGELLNAKKAA